MDYLDYASGEAMRGHDALAAVGDLLARLRGGQASDLEVAETQAATRSEHHEPAELTPPTTAMIGGYHLEGELGRGGMGVVYRARQTTLNRLVALKVLPPSMAGDPVTVARFRREVSALARCDHPNVVKVLATGVDGDTWWYAMELVDGVDLGSVYEVLHSWDESGARLGEHHLGEAVSTSTEVQEQRRRSRAEQMKAVAGGREVREAEVDRGPAPPEVPATSGGYYKRLAELMAGACAGVDHLHQHGVVHRDVKPANLMLTRDGSRMVVMDLGLAQLEDASAQLTRSSVRLLGTLRYMAPEQLQRRLL